MKILENHREFYEKMQLLSQSERKQIHSTIDDMRRAAANSRRDMQPYIFYIRQIAGEYEEINGKVRSVNHIERTEREKEDLALLASFADLEEDPQKKIMDYVISGQRSEQNRQNFLD